MTRARSHILTLLFWGGIALGPMAAMAQEAVTDLCPVPALERVQTHRVATGETLDAIAARYNLLAATLIGMNLPLESGTVRPGQVLRVPPFNGIEVIVPAGSSWADLAATYQVRADVLFEINGCPLTPPRRIFVPGVNWFPGVEHTPRPESGGNALGGNPLGGYPLGAIAPIVTSFGWQPHPTEDRLVFNSGITLATDPEAPVLVVGPGTVAFAGDHDTLGTLVVVNHAQGIQTRYGGVTAIQVQVGDTVTKGQTIAQVLPNPDIPDTAYLYLEVRTNSELGWVARNPGDYIEDLAVR
ncbi:M23 family metallopeptidase [Leptolyngbya sp. PCC 6406]|uniref:M23 family metallopeptidase n=1 Tax=Leptolyngbya sp. PCC 6406 TaxID=1173264 RepID=UPI0002AC4EE2|nr:M23 family metallopeptidase [Leptolyngbya sp. PCC 6406]